MKKCLYCVENIQDESIKCRYCGEFLNKKQEQKWYFKTHWLIIAFLSIGPLALPLLWLNPCFNQKTKIIITVIVMVLTCFLTILMIKSLKTMSNYYQQILQFPG